MICHSQYINYCYCYEDKIHYKKQVKEGRAYLESQFKDEVHRAEEVTVAGMCHGCRHYISSQETEMNAESQFTFSYLFCPEHQPNE